MLKRTSSFLVFPTGLCGFLALAFSVGDAVDVIPGVGAPVGDLLGARTLRTGLLALLGTRKLLGTSASLLVTSALLVVTRSY